MKIEIKELVDGIHVNKIFWVCDFRWDDFSKKPIRNIKPTKVINVENNGVRVNYSDTHFKKINNKVVVKSSVIKIFDNTGYRSYAGIPLNVFDNETECIKYYKKQCSELLKGLIEYENSVLSNIEKIKKELTTF